MGKFSRGCGVGAGCLALLGCTVMRPLTTNPMELQQTLHQGDYVDVATVHDQDLQFKVASVDARGLHGDGNDVAYSDIRSVSRQETSGGRTALVVLGALAVGAAAASGGGGHGGSGMGGGGGY
jgi:hypothetical protein